MSCMTPLRVLCDVASGLSPEAFRCLRYSAIYAPDMLPRPRTLPSGFIPPCLPTKAPRPPSGAMWLHEIKHDGFRVIARKDGGRVKLYSRPGNDLTWRFSLIVEAVGRLRSRSCIIDGEAVPCDDNGVSSFDRIRHRDHDDCVFLYAFDLIELNGDDLRRDPLVVRKATLTSVLAPSLASGSTITWNLRMGKPCSDTPAGSGSKASCRSGRTRPIARGGLRTGSK